MVVPPRLGQSAFRVIVTDAYERRCAITGEGTPPVLEPAHIKPYSSGGPHEPENGLLLRSDLHTLADQGYVTVDADQLKVVVSSRIREGFLRAGETIIIFTEEQYACRARLTTALTRIFGFPQ